jgi:uncharacterized protein (DUF924 family)
METFMHKSMLMTIYSFWFGDTTPANELDEARIRYWMVQDDETDNEIRKRFGHLIAEAALQKWDLGVLSREEGVALVVLFDQFPRNIYRTSGEAFAYDHIARDLARRLTANGWERFTAMERFILGLPFVHHEDAADQDFAVLQASQIVVNAPEHEKEGRRFHLDQATRHRDLIRRFGRFPHRNVMLGRESTPEELAFMAQFGRGF